MCCLFVRISLISSFRDSFDSAVASCRHSLHSIKSIFAPQCINPLLSHFNDSSQASSAVKLMSIQSRQYNTAKVCGVMGFLWPPAFRTCYTKAGENNDDMYR